MQISESRTRWKWLCAVNDYRLMRTESDSNKAPQMSRQTDLQWERDASSLWSDTSWISISITGILLGGPRPAAWVGGVKPPHCQELLASSIVFLLLLLSSTPERNCAGLTCGSILSFPPLPLGAIVLCEVIKHALPKYVGSPLSHISWKLIEWLQL